MCDASQQLFFHQLLQTVVFSSYLWGAVELMQSIAGSFPTASIHHKGAPLHDWKWERTFRTWTQEKNKTYLLSDAYSVICIYDHQNFSNIIFLCFCSNLRLYKTELLAMTCSWNMLNMGMRCFPGAIFDFRFKRTPASAQTSSSSFWFCLKAIFWGWLLSWSLAKHKKTSAGLDIKKECLWIKQQIWSA